MASQPRNTSQSNQGSAFYEHTDVADQIVLAGLSAHAAWITDRKEWAYRDDATLLWQHGPKAAGLVRRDILGIIQHISHTAPRAACNKMAKINFIDGVERCLTTIVNPLFTNWADWDADDYVIQTPGGVYEFGQGVLRPTGKGDRHLLSTMFTPERGLSPVFDNLTLVMMHGNPVMRNYLLNCLSFGLLGKVCERNYFVLLGGTNTGKSTLLDFIVMLLGSYATIVKSRVFAARQGRFDEYEESRLARKRFCATDEIEKDATLNEGLIKKLTGGRWATARNIYQPVEEFTPKATIWMSANDLPRLQHGGGPIVSRERIIQADARPQQDDPHLFNKLMQEAPAILWKLCQRATDYLAKQDMGLGFAAPASVMEAVEDHAASVSAVEPWVDEEITLTRDPDDFIPSDVLFRAFRLWCGRTGSTPGFSDVAGFALRLQQVLNHRTYGAYGTAIRRRISGQPQIRGFTRLTLKVQKFDLD